MCLSVLFSRADLPLLQFEETMSHNVFGYQQKAQDLKINQVETCCA